MQQVDKTNRSIILSVVIIDLIVINIFFMIFNCFWKMFFGEPVFLNNANYIIHGSLSVSYVITVFFNGVFMYHRRIRKDQIALISLKNMILFFIVWLAISAVIIPQITISKSIISFFCFVTIAIIVLRLAFLSFIMSHRRKGRNRCNVVYLGSSSNMQELFDEMALMLTTGYHVLGYFDDMPNPIFDKKCQYLGTTDQALEYLNKNDINRVYCGLTSSYGKSIITPVITYCEQHLIRFYSIPNLRNYFHRRVTLEMFSNVPMLSIHTEPLSVKINKYIKRTFDFVFSLLFLCTIFPFVYAIVGIITKITSPGPIFFKQKRHGLDGKEFWCYKFRSMKVNADADKVQATEDDPRKTKFGDLLRRTSVDEFPQFINVLKGDMSVVGPRPHMIKHTKEYSAIIDTYMVRHYVRPGVTGWAQVTGFRGETKELSDMQGRIKADIWYLEHWTLMLDLYIIFKTVANIVGRKDKTAY